MAEDKHKSWAVHRADPSVAAANLVSGDLSDTVDLAIVAKAFEVANNTTATIKVKFTPLGDDPATTPAAVVVSIPAGMVRVVPVAAKRFWSTGSDGLAAGLGAGTVDVLLHQR